jgi:uroporphyrinogen decarboxylase
MDKFDRLMATFSGGYLDRWAYALWKHFPGDDRTPQGFADAHVKFQRMYDSDVLKLTPHSSFCTVDWGCDIGPIHPVYGSTSVLNSPFESVSEFEAIEEVDPTDGEFGLQLNGVQKVSQILSENIPLMMTVFSPFMVASQLDSNILEHIFEAPSQIGDGLEVITKVITEFGRAVLDTGANGLFIASLHSVEGKLKNQQFLDFEVKYTLKLLNDLRPHAEFIVFHIHGNKPLFKYIADNYPVDAINWHSQHTSPKIEDALKNFNKGLFGGLDETETIRKGTQLAITTQLQEVMMISNSRLLLAPGCVIPIDTPEENLRVITEVIKNSPPPIMH